MEKQPLVSVGIPTYNRPEGLQKTLECITTQTYQNLEIIISDNCSPDLRVWEIVQDFLEKDKRITYIRQTENIGAANNFKFVLEKATGEYFMWAADDDEWETEFIKVCMQLFYIYPNAVAATTACSVIDQTSNQQMLLKNINTTQLNSIRKFIFALSYMLTNPNTFFYSIYRKETILRCNLNKKYYGSDQGVMLQLLQYGDFVSQEDAALYTYKIGLGASSNIENYKNLLKINSHLQRHFFVTGHLIGLSNEIFQLEKITLKEKLILIANTIKLFKRKKYYLTIVKNEFASFNYAKFIFFSIKKIFV